MNKKELTKNAKELKKLKLAEKELKEKINLIEQQFKDYFKEKNIDEFSTDLIKIYQKEITTNTFNQKNFKEQHAELFNQYVEQKTQNRLYVK